MTFVDEQKVVDFWKSATSAGVIFDTIVNFTSGTVSTTSGGVSVFFKSDLRASAGSFSMKSIAFDQAAANFLATSGLLLMKSLLIAVPAIHAFASGLPDR